MMMMMRRRRRKIYKTSDAQCNFSPPNERYPAHPWASITALKAYSFSLYTEHDVI